MAKLARCGACGKQFPADDGARYLSTACPHCGAELVVRGQTGRAHDVFISHSTVDGQVANSICSQMERFGLTCWIAPRDVPSGSEYAEAIVDGVEQTGCVLLVLSAAANESSHVGREVELAASIDTPVVPFRIEPVEPGKSLRFFLAGRHWHDAFNGPLESHVERLLPPLLKLLRTRGAAPDDSSRERPVAAPERPSNSPPASARPRTPEAVRAPSFHFGGVVPPEYFIGRAEELRTAVRAVCGKNNLLLVGELRAGKTSFGQMLIHHIMGRPQNTVLGTYVNVQSWPELTVEAFLEHTILSLVGEIARQVFRVKRFTLAKDDPAAGREDLEGDAAFASFLEVYRFVRDRTYEQRGAVPESFRIEEFAEVHSELMDIIHARGWEQCFVFYDEANRLGREESVDMLLSHQEALSISGLTSIYAASPAMVDSRPALQDWFVNQLRIGPFDSDEEMRRLLARYYFDDAERWEEVPANKEALRQLWRLSRGMPFLIQLIAGASFDLAHRLGDNELSSRHIDEAHAKLVKEKPTAFTTGGD